MTKTAVLVDGAFFLRRYKKIAQSTQPLAPQAVADALFAMCVAHLKPRQKPKHKQDLPRSELYRIFYYDCPPSEKRVHHPLTGRAIHFRKTDVFRFQTDFFRALSKKRKVALRFGHLAEGTAGWRINADSTRLLLKGEKSVGELKDKDVYYDIKQKGVDMRLGLDVASLAYKKLVDQIVLVAGDADFVPATRLARREGIDVVLDPMWQSVSEDLFLHIDGLRSTFPKPNGKSNEAEEEVNAGT